MPISSAKRCLYPPDWEERSRAIREDRARGLCECAGECGDEHDGGRCSALNGVLVRRLVARPAVWVTLDEALHLVADDARARMRVVWADPHGIEVRALEADGRASRLVLDRPVRVILTCAHLDQDPTNNDPANLRALCQRCHLRHDARWRSQAQAARRGRGQHQLFDVGEAWG